MFGQVEGVGGRADRQAARHDFGPANALGSDGCFGSLRDRVEFNLCGSARGFGKRQAAVRRRRLAIL